MWPMGTLKQMPLVVEKNIVRGPGVFDMKGGLTQMIFALRALKDAGAAPAYAPVVMVNSDEEIGSRESRPAILQQAQPETPCRMPPWCRFKYRQPYQHPILIGGRLPTRHPGR